VAVIRRCAAFGNAQTQSAGSLADSGWFFLRFEPQTSCLKLLSALADGQMLVFQHPVTFRESGSNINRKVVYALKSSRPCNAAHINFIGSITD
jgi:hypothetical protein